MRIALLGTHGVGKTYLLNMIHEQYKIPKITNTARSVYKKMGITSTKQILEAIYHKNYSLVENLQSDIFRTQIVNEIDSGLNFITDRSILDVAAYTELYLPGSDLAKNQRKSAIFWASESYEIIFYLPIPKNLELYDDGFRLTSLSEEYNNILVSIMADSYGTISVQPLSRVTQEKRSVWFEEVVKVIEKAKQN